MYLVLDKEDFDNLVSFKDSAPNPAYLFDNVGLFSDSKKARAYCRTIIADELAHDEEPSTFVILDINEFRSSIITGKLGVIISNRDLK